MQEEEYRNHFGVSQSMIKAFQHKSPKAWKSIFIDRQVDLGKNEDSFTMGSLIDCLLFTPKTIDEKFYKGEEKLPSKAIASIIRSYYQRLIDLNKAIESISDELPTEPMYHPIDIHENEESLLYCANNYCFKDGDEEKCGWNIGWKDETRVRNLIEKGNSYFESLKKAAGRKIISNEMNIEAINLVNILRSDLEVRDYFVANDSNHLMFQLEIFVECEIEDKMVPLKGALDIVRFNHLDKTVQIIDFKSSYSAFSFLHSIKQFGYCDQLSYYDFLLRIWLKQYCDGSFCDYKILAPINVVIDINDKIPYIYQYNWVDIGLAADGNVDFLYHLYGTHDHNARIKRGWKKSLEDIAWHLKENKWDKPKELYTNGFIKVNLN